MTVQAAERVRSRSTSCIPPGDSLTITVSRTFQQPPVTHHVTNSSILPARKKNESENLSGLGNGSRWEFGLENYRTLLDLNGYWFDRISARVFCLIFVMGGRGGRG